MKLMMTMIKIMMRNPVKQIMLQRTRHPVAGHQAAGSVLWDLYQCQLHLVQSSSAQACCSQSTGQFYINIYCAVFAVKILCPWRRQSGSKSSKIPYIYCNLSHVYPAPFPQTQDGLRNSEVAQLKQAFQLSVRRFLILRPLENQDEMKYFCPCMNFRAATERKKKQKTFGTLVSFAAVFCCVTPPKTAAEESFGTQAITWSKQRHDCPRHCILAV